MSRDFWPARERRGFPFRTVIALLVLLLVLLLVRRALGASPLEVVLVGLSR